MNFCKKFWFYFFQSFLSISFLQIIWTFYRYIFVLNYLFLFIKFKIPKNIILPIFYIFNNLYLIFCTFFNFLPFYLFFTLFFAHFFQFFVLFYIFNLFFNFLLFSLHIFSMFLIYITNFGRQFHRRSATAVVWGQGCRLARTLDHICGPLLGSLSIWLRRGQVFLRNKKNIRQKN